MPEVHAKLSASGAKKWMNCPGSITLEEQIREKPSEYAAEGTAAHALGEAKIRLALKEFTRAKYHKAIKDLPIDKDMEDYTDAYRDFVIEEFNAVKRETPDAVLLLEQRLDFSDWVPAGFGTGDCIIISNGKVHIIDLKYGKGVAVYAQDNPQLRLYALGALSAYDFLYDIQEVSMTIFQPRKDIIDTETMETSVLYQWGESVKLTAQEAYAGSEKFCAGPHCDSGFCKARPICRVYAEKRMEMAKYEFAKPATLSPEEISEILEEAEALSKWATLIKDYALDEVVNNGAEFPGYKVVEGRSNRVFNLDDTLIAGQLIAKGFNEDDIWPRKLKTVSALEKYLGKKEFEKLLGEFVVKPQGKPTLVPITDNRPAFGSSESAAKDFENVMDH